MVTEISAAQSYEHTVDQLDIAYLAGVVDAKANFRLHIQPNAQRDTGYSFSPQIRINMEDSELFLNMVDAYCEEVDSSYFLGEQPNVNQIVINGLDAVDNFVGPLAQFFLFKREEIEALAEIIDGMREDKHLSEEGIIELMEPTNVLQESREAGRKSKYTEQFFKEEFNL